MKKLLLLLIFPLLFSCGSDDDNGDDGEKIEVTESDFSKIWEYTNTKTQVTHVLYFFYRGEDRILMGTHEQYKDDKLSYRYDFNFTITGTSMSVNGGTPTTIYTTDFFKRDDKLYFLDMPFTPYVED